MVILIFNSCTKETNEISTINPLEKFSIDFDVDNGMLVFPSPNEYQCLLDTLANKGYDYFIEWDNESEFKSIRTIYSEKECLDELTIDDELFAMILNQNYQIKIGEFIFELDPKLEQIHVISNEKDLKSSENCTYSFEDEVIPFLFEGKSLKSVSSCETLDNASLSVFEVLEGVTVTCKAKYYKAAIFNSIYVEMNLSDCLLPNIEICITTGYSNCTYNYCQSSYGLSFSERKVGCKIYENLYRKWHRVGDCDLEVDYSAVSPNGGVYKYLEIKN